jgi:hypothetical protein
MVQPWIVKGLLFVSMEIVFPYWVNVETDGT